MGTKWQNNKLNDVLKLSSDNLYRYVNELPGWALLSNSFNMHKTTNENNKHQRNMSVPISNQNNN